jgi:putative salt-induced outer membrane protein YdiY
MTPSQPKQRLALGLVAGAVAFCSPLLALAQAPQAPAQGTLKTATATSGSTEVTTGTFDAAKQSTEAADATEAKLQLGALLSTGNARSLASTASGSMRLRRQSNELSAVVAANYARAAATPAADTQTTMENYQGKLRYDRFVTQNVSLFLSLSGRRDRFQGLDARLNLDPGLAYYFIAEEKQRLWGELGYDLQYDLRRNAAIAVAAEKGTILGKTKSRHSARGFVGYHTNVNEHVGFDTGAELLLGIPETENWRLNWLSSLTTALDSRFSLGATFNLRYDHNPLPGIEKLDTVTSMNLICTLY